MKKLKIVLFLLFIGIIGLIVFQNKEYMFMEQGLQFNTYLSDPYYSPPFPNAIWLVLCIAIGFLVSYFSNLVERYRSNKVQRELNAKIESQIDMISKLRAQLEPQGAGVGTESQDTDQSTEAPPDTPSDSSANR